MLLPGIGLPSSARGRLALHHRFLLPQWQLTGIGHRIFKTLRPPTPRQPDTPFKLPDPQDPSRFHFVYMGMYKLRSAVRA